MSKLILKNIIDEIPFESLPANWQSFELKRVQFNMFLNYKSNIRSVPITIET